MTEIKVLPLGAGQDVGRSCIIVSMGGKHIMLDCGMHMGYNDDRRFPDFSYICREESLNSYLDCVIISHFHLDHCGALPHMTEMVGYDGPIYMTHPTKAICPILLEDYRKISVDRKGEVNFFTSADISRCMNKVTPVYLHQTVKVDPDMEIKAYYAGHVLGAAIFYIRVGNQSIVYTGDYNMTPDRHLGAAWIDRCQPDLLITESTYATTIRDSKRCRERDFLEKVHNCVENGGKVLIPVFALGRAQELCILLETYWDRMNLKVPIFFSTGLTEKANNYYKLYISWTNQKIKDTFVERNMFDFKHIKPFDKSFIDNPGAMVVFATPGMLHAGQSLQIFKRWAPHAQNMVIMPGYCVAGTIGYKVLNGARKLEFEKQTLEVNLSVEYLSFSAHADAKGIMQLIRHCDPRCVLLVHGENAKMEFLKSKIQQELGLMCYKPANGDTVTIETTPVMIAEVPAALLGRRSAVATTTASSDQVGTNGDGHEALETLRAPRLLRAGCVMRDKDVRLMEVDAALATAGLAEHSLRFTSTLLYDGSSTLSALSSRLLQICRSSTPLPVTARDDLQGGIAVGDAVTVIIKEAGGGGGAASKTSPEDSGASATTFDILVSYAFHDEALGTYISSVLKQQLESGTV